MFHQNPFVMKCSLYSVLTLQSLFLVTHLHAQDTTTLDGKIRSLFEPLDKTEMATDILIQQTPVFLWPGVYDGNHVPDSLALSRAQWGTLYGQFRDARVNGALIG